VVAESARLSSFVRAEELSALARQLEELGALERAWTKDVVLERMREVGLVELSRAIAEHVEQSSGLSAWFSRAGARLETAAFDLVRGGLFLANQMTDHEGRYEDGTWQNWSRSYEARPKTFAVPTTANEIAMVVAKAEKLRVVGGGHTFNDSPLSSDTMLSLDGYDDFLSSDPPRRIAHVQAGIRLRDLNRALFERGLALPMLGSTDAQSIGGLIATDLHGSGRDHGFLSEQVLSIRVLDHEGKPKTVRRGNPLFHAVFGALGTCGVVTEVELELVNAFNVAKTTQVVDRAASEANVEALIARNDHISFYYLAGGGEAESVRLHQWNRVNEPVTPDWPRLKALVELTDFGISAFLPSVAELIAAIDEDSVLSNLLAPDHRLVMPSSAGFGRKLFYRHDEIEYGVPFERWLDCLGEVMDLLRERRFFSVVEVRFTPDRSQALLGPGVGRRTCYIELATPLGQDTAAVYDAAEDIFRAHGGQPHLGKKTRITAQEMLEIYGERFLVFQEARRAQDPKGKFSNAFTARVLGSP
jgi:FAD/FMN-containing dehydrogenase